MGDYFALIGSTGDGERNHSPRESPVRATRYLYGELVPRTSRVKCQYSTYFTVLVFYF